MSVEHSTKPLEEQLLYKLGSLEGTVINGMRRLDEQLTAFVESFDKHQSINTAELDSIKKRLTDLETWRTGAKVRVATLVTAVTVAWAVFSDNVKHIIDNITGNIFG